MKNASRPILLGWSFLAVLLLGCNPPSNAFNHNGSHATIEITAGNFETLVLQSDKLVLVDFWAPWCDPCVRLAPTMEQMATDFQGKLVVGKINVDEQPALAQKFKIEGIPALIYFKNGQTAKTSVGLQSAQEIRDDIEALID